LYRDKKKNLAIGMSKKKKLEKSKAKRLAISNSMSKTSERFSQDAKPGGKSFSF
jgi:hypothetical protein